jgi:hypothetical protein
MSTKQSMVLCLAIRNNSIFCIFNELNLGNTIILRKCFKQPERHLHVVSKMPNCTQKYLKPVYTLMHTQWETKVIIYNLLDAQSVMSDRKWAGFLVVINLVRSTTECSAVYYIGFPVPSPLSFLLQFTDLPPSLSFEILRSEYPETSVGLQVIVKVCLSYYFTIKSETRNIRKFSLEF